MRRHITWVIPLALGLGFISFPAWAGQGETTVKGEVVEVQQRVQTENGGEFDRLRVRTRQGEEMQLQLGKAGSCPNCLQVGDQIRAKVRTGAGGEMAQVQTVRVRRNGSMQGFRFRDGELAQDRSTVRARDGSGDGRSRRGPEQGSDSGWNCPGNRYGPQGSGRGGSGSSRGGGRG